MNRFALAALPLLLANGCASSPSPLAPQWNGSIGTPGRGVLAGGTEVCPDGLGLRWLRHNDRHWACSRFAGAVQRAASNVARQRPGGVLYVGDFSVRGGGGPLAPHFSHRSGMDADLLFYVTELDGLPVASPGFVHFEADGLAHDDAHGRWLRLDLDREWLLVKELLEDPQARVQWIFVSDVVKALLLEWALARGDSTDTIYRAQQVMAQPKPGGVHDDHLHVRTTCTADETASGCVPVGPRRPWLTSDASGVDESDEVLAAALFELPRTPTPTVTSDTPDPDAKGL